MVSEDDDGGSGGFGEFSDSNIDGRKTGGGLKFFLGLKYDSNCSFSILKKKIRGKFLKENADSMKNNRRNGNFEKWKIKIKI